VIRVQDLTKYYGSTRGAEDVSFEIQDGEIFGLVGPNGAGKSTVINTMIGILKPGRGKVYYDNIEYDGRQIEVKRLLGVVPEKDFLFEYLTVDEQITYLGRIYGISPGEVSKRIDEFYSYFKFFKNSTKLISELSKGNRKLVAFMSAIIHNPRYLILDEPLEGLDVMFSAQIKQILLQMRTNVTNILITSHDLHLIEKICDRIGVLLNGELVFSGTIDSVRGQIQEKLKRQEGMLESYVLSLIGKVPEADLSWLKKEK